MKNKTKEIVGQGLAPAVKKLLSLTLALFMAIIPLCSGFAAYAADTGVQIENFKVVKAKYYGYNLKWSTTGKAPEDAIDNDFQTQMSVNGGKFKNCSTENLGIVGGVKYKFRVRHYISKYDVDKEDYSYIYGKWVECSYQLKQETPTFRFTATSTGFKYSIGTDYFYDKYEIYKYDSKKKKYVRYKTINKDYDGIYPEIKSSTLSYYKVRGKAIIDGKTYYSKLSNKIQARSNYKTKVTLNSVKSNKVGKVTVKWKKSTAKGVSGYQIRVTSAASFNDYYKTFKIKGTKTVSKTLSLFEGLTYKVKIRPYFEKAGGTIYGAWSSAKTVCVKAGIGGTVDAKKLVNKQKLSKQKAKNKRLDKILDKIISKYTNSKMSTYEKLFACYKYVSNEKFKKENYSSIKGSDDSIGMERLALALLNSKKGDCTMYNSLFCVLAKKIGIKDVRLVGDKVKGTNGGWTDHSWCVVKMNGHFYIFDPRLEMHKIKSGGSKSGKTYFCVPLSDKNKTAQQYRFVYPDGDLTDLYFTEAH